MAAHVEWSCPFLLGIGRLETEADNRKNSCSEAEKLVENMNKSKEFMFMGRNVIENMNKSQVFMFRGRNMVKNMNK